MQTLETLTINVPYPLRHLTPELKARGGRFDPETKTWTLADTEENRALAAQFRPQPKPLASPQERIRSVAQTAVDLLNSLKVGKFHLVEVSTTRLVIEAVTNR